MTNPFDMLLFPEDTSQIQSSWRWATVTSVNPARVRLDGDAFPLTIVPVNLAGPGINVGTRVWVQLFRGRDVAGTRVFIHGAGGGGGGQPYAQAAGLADVTGNGSNEASKTFNFPSGRFTQPPIVTTDNATTNTDVYIGDASLITATKMLITVTRRDLARTFAGTYTIQWHAIQMTATSAAG